jgi:hypothetical protein
MHDAAAAPPPLLESHYRAVRSILGISLILIGMGVWACQVEGTADRAPINPPSEPTWVRTVDGWERPATWSPPAFSPSQLHPLIVAAGQLFASLFALAAWSPQRAASDASMSAQ